MIATGVQVIKGEEKRQESVCLCLHLCVRIKLCMRKGLCGTACEGSGSQSDTRTASHPAVVIPPFTLPGFRFRIAFSAESPRPKGKEKEITKTNETENHKYSNFKKILFSLTGERTASSCLSFILFTIASFIP